MIIKNYPFAYLAAIFPARLVLEGVAFVFSALIRDWKRMAAITMAIGWNLFHPFLLIKKHKEAGKKRKPQAVAATLRRMYGGSIFFQYFIRGQKRARDIEV
jgi:hypothetical protein